MTAAALEQVFTSASNEDARRAEQSRALKALVTGPAGGIVTLLGNINSAADTIRKSHGVLGRFGDEGMKFYMKLFEGAARRTADDAHSEKTIVLNQGGNLGRGVAFTFRDDGTMKIAQQNTHYVLTSDPVRYYGTRQVTDSVTAYEGPVDAAEAREQIGIYLAHALEEQPRRKLQAAVANITPATGGPSLLPS